MFVMIFDHRNELFQKVLRDVETARSKRYVDQLIKYTYSPEFSQSIVASMKSLQIFEIDGTQLKDFKL